MSNGQIFLATLISKEGKGNFIIMCFFIVATILITSFFKNYSWSVIVAFITSIISISAGTEFSKVLLLKMKEADPNNKK